MSEAAWNKAFTHGSKALQDRLKNVHAKNPKFQSWLKSSGHGAGQSVGQASKEVKTSERAKGLKTKSLAAYGATKGTRMGSAEGTGETVRDTVKPLTPEQHAKIAVAKREAKKASAPKRTTPLSHSERMSAIRSAVQKAASPKRQARFDIPTLEKDHEDLRHDHDLMHSVGVRQSYNEGFDPSPDEIAKMLVDKHGPNITKAHIEDLEQDRDSHHALDHEAIMKSVKKLTQNEETRQEAEKLLGGPVRAKSELPPARNPLRNRARNLARQQAEKAAKAAAGKPVTEEKEMSSYGKALARMIMAKKSQHPIAQHMGEAADDESREYDYEGDMAKSQLKSIITNAQRLHDSLEDDTNLPEWVQLKITLAEDYVVTAANYMEGELDESVEIDEAHMTDAQMKRRERLVKSMKSADWEKRYPGRGEKVMYATATKMAMKEEAELDEAIRITRLGKQLPPKSKRRAAGGEPTKSDKLRDLAAVGAKEKRAMFGGRLAGMNAYHDFKPIKNLETGYVGAKKTNEEAEQVAEDSEGSIPTTPKEKELAKHHGDPNRITYGDVIKARLKAAAKKGK